MQISGFSCCTTDWSKVEKDEHKGDRGIASWFCILQTFTIRDPTY